MKDANRYLRLAVIALLAVVAMAFANSSHAQGPPGQSLAVPAYFEPGADWTRLQQSTPTAALAVINPDNGPGLLRDAAYAAQVRSAQAAGLKVLGYVSTDYGQRLPLLVALDVISYYNAYPLDGIFFDEAATDCVLEPYYALLQTLVKARSSQAMVALNPGTDTSECYMQAADIVLNFEDSAAVYAQWQPAAWVDAYPASRFWHIVLSTAQARLPATMARSRSLNAGYVYVTPDSPPEPYSALPPQAYWNAELAAAAAR